MSVLLLTDDAMDAHRTPGHPERPERREAVADGVRDAASAAGIGLVEGSVEELGGEDLRLVHDPDYLTLLAAVENGGGGAWLDPDTYLVTGSLRAARLAAGATVQAARAAAAGQAELAFAVVRPPGHHATAERGGGFCLFNNVALAVAALRRDDAAQRIAILDWDVHHGDGTQAIFDADPDLCYVSTHQSPFYPGTGAAADRGSGLAAGTKNNHPLAAGSGDGEFVAAWRDELLPAVEAFAPEAILVSAGYDAHRDDPLAGLMVTELGFAEAGRLLGELSSRLGVAGIALTLEGGYDLDGLRASAEATVQGILHGRRGAPGGD